MICSRCGQQKLSTEFYRSNQASCRTCLKAAAAARRRADPAAHRQATQRWREREQQRADLLEHVLRMLAARDPEGFFAAVVDAEDTLGMEPGAALELFSRRANHVSSSVGETTTTRDRDAAA